MEVCKMCKSIFMYTSITGTSVVLSVGTFKVLTRSMTSHIAGSEKNAVPIFL